MDAGTWIKYAVISSPLLRDAKHLAILPHCLVVPIALPVLRIRHSRQDSQLDTIITLDLVRIMADDRGGDLQVILIVCLILCIISTSLRFYSMGVLLKRFYVEDWIALVTLV
jgi:hypothetical protein